MIIKSKITKNTLNKIKKISKVKLTLGSLIYAVRAAEGISQVDFASMLDMTKQHLCDIEHNRKAVSPKLAAKYAEILGYSSDQFIRLALQDSLDREGLNVKVNITLLEDKKRFKVLKYKLL